MDLEQYQKLMKRKRLALIADIIVIIFFVCFAIYIFKNIEYIKMMASDPCRICMNNTGATCWKFTP